ncbi:MAG: putative dsRNA-binding protein, partial [Pseudothermotoga sp.]
IREILLDPKSKMNKWTEYYLYVAARSELVQEIKHYLLEGKIVFDYKTFLQEMTQERFKQLPEYVLVDEQGPSHMKRFTVELRLNRKVIATGEGFSIKEAEKNAAKKAIEKLEGE